MERKEWKGKSVIIKMMTTINQNNITNNDINTNNKSRRRMFH
jgi:hypothetical protein